MSHYYPETPAELQLPLDQAIMKIIQSLDDMTAKRKSLKPQVERRRRERMNRSLESLKTLLLQEATERRVEKAEVLEHTVLFLQSSVPRVEDGGGQKHSFQDGFSSCLQRAVHFLGPEGKDLWIGTALNATFAARCPRPDSVGIQKRTEVPPSSSSLFLTKSSRSTRQLLVNRSGHRLQSSLTQRIFQNHSSAHRCHTTPQQLHQVSSRVSKQSPPQRQAVIQSLWRPWP
ncbi:uncharacterized protein V6R79_026324 [Siganus canaliculatus]